MAGDTLARGARSAVFPPAGGNVSQEKWDAIWESDTAGPMGPGAEEQKEAEAGSNGTPDGK